MSKIYAIYPKCRENLLGQEVSNQKNKKNKKKIVTKNEKKQIRKNGLGVSVLFQVCVKTIIHETVFLKSWNTFPQHTHLF